jgi:predicted alpha/beta-hydrolase family hydrolase
MRLYRADSRDHLLLVLGHGAGAGEQHPWMQKVGQGLANRGVSVATFDFPYMAAGRKLPDPNRILEDAFTSAVAQADGLVGARIRLVGGKSMGGRIASQVLAAGGFVREPDGLVCFGYPLHPPGKPGQRRDRHLPDIRQPILFVQGTRDPFGTPDEMRTLVGGLKTATLQLVDGGDHSLETPRRGALAGASIDQALDAVASWIRGRGAPNGTDMMPE